MPRVIAEPGRALVGDAGVIVSEVILVSQKSSKDAGALGISGCWQIPRTC